MVDLPTDNIIASVRYWLSQTVIGYNFCPFARREFVKNTINYTVSSSNSIEPVLYELVDELTFLEQNPSVETTLIILPQGFQSFDDYLDLVDYSNQLLERLEYSGVYQIASFHPDYCFDGLDKDDPANYTNRSPYPILHILREASLDRALENYDDPESIPDNNVKLAREKGVATFTHILKKSFKTEP
ncbi:DUF1415 domain-containing protein [Kangiella geojedonensis]|uniref:Lipoprotein signal peptidase n=1 Tax=Kangiella geojedonensis TaxID=914150 RepID=A0A0F6TS70_9GAMM|nr:DUF1415 domain-containing protein [Kangiella geojedonensis]AKE53122.1 lipoprotein signal peptidase [Kangiella geojedonensis]